MNNETLDYYNKNAESFVYGTISVDFSQIQDLFLNLLQPVDRSAFPDDCLIDFDMKLIDLFEEMDKKHLKVRDQIRNEYFWVKELLGKRPSRMDLFTYMDDDVYQMAIAHSKDNPFKRYMEYLKELGEVTEEEEILYQGIGREFINLIENTNMSKVYKMPVHFMQESGKGFFVQRESAALALQEGIGKNCCEGR